MDYVSVWALIVTFQTQIASRYGWTDGRTGVTIVWRQSETYVEWFCAELVQGEGSER